MITKKDAKDVDLTNSEKYLRILLQIEIRKMFTKKDGSLKIADAARFLNSCGCTPTQVANLLLPVAVMHYHLAVVLKLYNTQL